MKIKEIEKLHYRGKNQDSVIVDINGKHFQTGFSQAEEGQPNYEKSKSELSDYIDNNDVNSVILNTTECSSNVLGLEASNLDFSKKNYHLLEKGNDGILLSGLNDVYSSEKFIKNHLGIIIGVRDCTPIIGSFNNGEHIFNLHGAYKGILGNESTPGILYNFFELLKKENLNLKDLDNLVLGPMAGENFEIRLDFIKKLGSEFKKEYNIKLENSFTPNGKIDEEGQIFGYFNIRNLINEILAYHGVDRNKVTDLGINTTDITNNWPSYRAKKDNPYKIGATVMKKIRKK